MVSKTDAFFSCVVGIKCSGWWTESFHDIVQRCHYQRAWLVSSWLIRFSVGQVVLSGLPWSTSPPILWALSGSAVSMQSWTIKGKSFWPPAGLWESAVLASSAYFDQSGYKWTFTSRQPSKHGPEPCSHIGLFNIPYLKRPTFWQRRAWGHAFFHSREHNKIHCYVVSGCLTRDVHSSNLDWFSETFSPQRPCHIFNWMGSFFTPVQFWLSTISYVCPVYNEIKGTIKTSKITKWRIRYSLQLVFDTGSARCTFAQSQITP